MITRTQYANVNLIGDGESTSISLELADEVTGTIKNVVSVELRGPNPLPKVKGKVDEVKGTVDLKFSPALNKFVGNNGYTAFIILEVA